MSGQSGSSAPRRRIKKLNIRDEALGFQGALALHYGHLEVQPATDLTRFKVKSPFRPLPNPLKAPSLCDFPISINNPTFLPANMSVIFYSSQAHNSLAHTSPLPSASLPEDAASLLLTQRPPTLAPGALYSPQFPS